MLVALRSIAARPIAEAEAYFKASLAEFAAHGMAHHGGIPECEVRHVFHDDRTVIVQLWQPDRSWQGQALLWDGLTLAFDTRDQVAELLGFFERAGVKSVPGPIARTPDIREPLYLPMFQYHPQRFRAVLPIAKAFAQAAQTGEPPMFTMEAMEFGAERYRASQNQQALQTPLRNMLKTDPRGPQKLIQAAMFFGDFTQYGRQIFDFPSELVAGFRRSDVHDIPLAVIKLPYESFYLHFGPQLDLETAPGWHPDGAYVARVGDPHGRHAIQFCLTSAPKAQATYEDWLSHPEPFYIQAVPSELLETGVGEAVEQVLADRLAYLAKQAASTSGQADVDRAVEALQEESGIDSALGAVRDVSAQNASAEMASLPGQHKAWREMLNLVVNSIVYLTHYDDDVRTEWPKRTPVELLEQETEGTPKQRQRARSKLAALGYSAVHFCGTRFVETVNADDRAALTDPNVQRKSTWVRGSWVWQAHGPQWSQRRLQWRMPHIRNKDSGDAPTSHLYLVT